ncbi:MAG: hypothetical protein ACPGSI_17320 [Pikeienuella sp.]
MKLQIEPEAFRALIADAAMPVKRRAFPILECLLLRAKDNELRATGTDMETTAVARTDAAVSDPGDAVVRASDLVRMSNSATSLITIELIDSGLSLSTTAFSVTLPVMPVAEFPAKLAKPENEVEIEGGAEAVAFAMDHSDGASQDPHRAGVNFVQNLCFAGAGSWGAALPIRDDGAEACIPGSALPHIKKINGRLFIGDRMWRAERENLMLIGALVEGVLNLPPKLFAPDLDFFTVDADDFLSAIESATLGRAREVVVTVSGETLTVTGSRFDATHADTCATCRCDGAEGTQVFSVKQVANAIRPFRGSILRASLNEVATIFSAEGGDGRCTVVGNMRDSRVSLPAKEKEAA